MNRNMFQNWTFKKWFDPILLGFICFIIVFLLSFSNTVSVAGIQNVLNAYITINLVFSGDFICGDYNKSYFS